MIQKDENTRDQGSHARGVYPTQHTSRKGEARGGSSNREVCNQEERNVCTKGKSPKQALWIYLWSSLRDASRPYHRLD